MKSQFGRFWSGAILVALIIGVSGWHVACADEVDDILVKKTHNRDRIKKMNGEFVVETAQPATLDKPKTVRMHYKLTLERIQANEVKHSHNPWRLHADVLEPLPMRLRTEGEEVFFMDQHGAWINMPMTPELREQFDGMSERFMGADPAEQRKHFKVKVLRHNNPVFGPKTTTVEFIPTGRAKMFARMEEDDNADGLALATRLFDDSGKKTVEVKVLRHHKENGIPMIDEMDSASDGPAGQVTAHTKCLNSHVECQP